MSIISFDHHTEPLVIAMEAIMLERNSRLLEQKIFKLSDEQSGDQVILISAFDKAAAAVKFNDYVGEERITVKDLEEMQ